MSDIENPKYIADVHYMIYIGVDNDNFTHGQRYLSYDNIVGGGVRIIFDKNDNKRYYYLIKDDFINIREYNLNKLLS